GARGSRRSDGGRLRSIADGAAGPALRAFIAHHTGVRPALSGGFDRGRRRVGVVSGRKGRQTGSRGRAEGGMNVAPTQNVRIALAAVTAHRFRSLLTILGIVIGITTVVTVASLLTGLRQGVVVFFQELGPDNIFVFKTSGDPSQEPLKERKRRPMRPEYVDALRRFCTSVEDYGLVLYIPPVVEGHPITARVPGYETENINVNGMSANMAQISPRDLDAGRMFTPEEEQRGMHVAVIGSNVAGSLFPAGDAVNRTVMMDGAEYTIV